MRKKNVKVKKATKSYQGAYPDYVLGLLVLGLTLFGVLMVYNTSIIVAHEEFGDKFWFLKNQGLWAIVGITCGYIVSNVHYLSWKRWAKPLYLVSVVLLLLVLIPGLSPEVYGARRRLSFPIGLPFLGHLSIQPAELAKFTVVLYLAYWLTNMFAPGKKKGSTAKLLQSVPPFLGTLGIVIALIMLEPDLGTSLIIGGSSMMVYFLSGVPFVDIVVVGLLGILGAAGFAFSSEYRRNRILAFLNPTEDSLGISYHINQILIALGSGGLLGVGLGHSRQKYQYLPEVTTDSIFAIIGEELGFIGSTLIIVAFMTIIWRGFEIIKNCDEPFGKLLATGIVSIISVQAFLNLMSMVSLIPLTGVPLPFISYGGSSLTMLLVEVGILLNISKYARAG
jgi:cell division protein FtsW